MRGPEKLKQSLYFSEDVLREIMKEANRLDRSLSWTVQQAWRIAREEVRKFPAVEPRPPTATAPPPQPARPPAPVAASRPVPASADEAAREPSTQVRDFLRGKFDRS